MPPPVGHPASLLDLVDRMVIGLARSEGVDESVIRLAYGAPLAAHERVVCTGCGYVYDTEHAASECADMDATEQQYTHP